MIDFENNTQNIILKRQLVSYEACFFFSFDFSLIRSFMLFSDS